MALLLMNTLYKLVENGEFSIDFVKEDGSIVHAERVICTNWHSKGRTMNIKFLDSQEIRTIRRCTIIKFNNTEVCL